MSNLVFPTGKKIFENKICTREFLELTLDEIRGKADFTGYLDLDSEDIRKLLFFLKGRPYAAGKMDGQRPAGMNISDFFDDLPKGGDNDSFLSLYQTDPVLLKGMLIYFQREPAIKASTKMIDLDKIFAQIREKASALIVLKKREEMNFFFFLKGEAVMSHFAAAGDRKSDDLSVIDQLVLNAYPNDTSGPIDAFIYFDVATSPAADAGAVPEDVFMEANNRPKDIPQNGADGIQITLSVIKGPDRDRSFTVNLPCIIGRKEGGIVLQDTMVSGRHAIIKESDGKVLIEDMGSTNGTYVEGIEIKAKEILAGEVLTLGETQLKVDRINPPGP